MIARYIASITYENKQTLASTNVTKQSTVIFAETDFIECDAHEIDFINDCTKHKSNIENVFSRARSMIANDEILPGIVEWYKDPVYGDLVVVKYKNKYYKNIEPIWPDNVSHKEQPIIVGDRIITLTRKIGTVSQYIGNGFYLINFGKSIGKIHINGMVKYG